MFKIGDNEYSATEYDTWYDWLDDSKFKVEKIVENYPEI